MILDSIVDTWYVFDNWVHYIKQQRYIHKLSNIIMDIFKAPAPANTLMP